MLRVCRAFTFLCQINEAASVEVVYCSCNKDGILLSAVQAICMTQILLEYADVVLASRGAPPAYHIYRFE